MQVRQVLYYSNPCLEFIPNPGGTRVYNTTQSNQPLGPLEMATMPGPFTGPSVMTTPGLSNPTTILNTSPVASQTTNILGQIVNVRHIHKWMNIMTRLVLYEVSWPKK